MAKAEITKRPQEHHEKHDNRHRHGHHDQLIDRKQELREENIIQVQRNQLLSQIRNSMARLGIARNRGRAVLPGEETEEERLLSQAQQNREKQEKPGTELQNRERIALLGDEPEVKTQPRDMANRHESAMTADKVNVVAREGLDQTQEQADRTQNQAVTMADEAQIDQDLGAPELDVSHSYDNPIVFQAHLYKTRNRGAKEFDDFARGIQTWLSSLEMEAIKRFHTLHMDPIVDAFEEYVLKMAQSIADLIDKALLLCRLRICQKAAAEIARIAFEMIKKLVKEREEDIPVEKMFTWKRVQELQAELNTEG